MAEAKKIFLRSFVYWISLIVESTYRTGKLILLQITLGLVMEVLTWILISLTEGHNFTIQSIGVYRATYLFVFLVIAAGYFAYNLFITPGYWAAGKRLALLTQLERIIVFRRSLHKDARIAFEIINPKHSQDFCLKIENNERRSAKNVRAAIDRIEILQPVGEIPFTKNEVQKIRNGFPSFGAGLSWRIDDPHHTGLVTIDGRHKNSRNYAVADIAVAKYNNVILYSDQKFRNRMPRNTLSIGEYTMDIHIHCDMEKRYANFHVKLKIVYKGRDNLNIYIISVE